VIQDAVITVAGEMKSSRAIRVLHVDSLSDPRVLKHVCYAIDRRIPHMVH
jgi:hypothetical protein